jgi:hypothetical protein
VVLHRSVISVLCLALVAALGPVRSVRAVDAGSISDYTKIRSWMSKLSPLLGKWHADAAFADGRENIGTYDVHWALDDT